MIGVKKLLEILIRDKRLPKPKYCGQKIIQTI